MMNALPSCTPVIFGPHITPHCPAIPWWEPTPARFGWWIVAMTATAWLAVGIQVFIRNRWERTCGRPRFIRRWYAPGSVVRDRDSALDGMYRVRGWDDEDTTVPWLLLEELTDFEDADPLTFWAPVTSFASVTVRRFRPHLIRTCMFGRAVRVPWMVKYLPLPGQVAIWRGES